MKLQARLDTGTAVLTSIEIDDSKMDERHNLISGRIVNQPIGKLTEWSFNLALRLLHGGKRYEIYLQNDGTFASTLNEKPPAG